MLLLQVMQGCRSTFIVFWLMNSGFCYATEADVWQVSLGVAQHRIDFSPLSKGLYTAPFKGSGALINSDTMEQKIQTFEMSIPLKIKSAGNKATLQLAWTPNNKHHFILGIGFWELAAATSIQTTLPVQNELHPAQVNRKSKFSYSEYQLGWQYRFWSNPQFSLYSLLSFNELYDLNYDETLIFEFSQAVASAAFQRNIRVQARASGLLLFNIGGGIRYAVSRFFSLGLELSYLVGRGQVNYQNVTIKQDFLSDDDMTFVVAPFSTTDKGLLGQYRLPPLSNVDDDPVYEPVSLSFTGWQSRVQAIISFR